MNNDKGSELRVVYAFGEFRLDAARHLIYEGDSSTPLAIKPKVLEALLYFVEHPGELLDKDRLLTQLWPGVVVEENGLTQVISSLRRVLREAPGENRYLATVPGRGYRFVAGVSRVPDHGQRSPAQAPSSMPPVAEAPSTPSAAEPASMQAEGTEPHPSARYSLRRRSTLVLTIVALIAAIGAGLGLYAGLARWLAARESVATTASGSGTSARLSAGAVAVLPFENLSTDAENAYVAFGVAESVLHRLASIPDLTLVARTSSFLVGERPADIQEIGRKLNARYLVEGSVQRSGERLRVTAQLIDATTGGHLWSLRFDRTVDDIFAVEDEIARSIATALEVSLNREQHPHASFGTDAYLAYLQARALLATSRVEDAELAIEHFKHAIEISPEFAAAYAGLANAHWRTTLYQETGGTGFTRMAHSDRHRQRLEAGVREVQPPLDRALELDDTLGEAYILRADLKALMEDVDGAHADYRKGLTLDGSNGAAFEGLAKLYRLEGSDDQARAEIDRAIRVDPLSPRNYFVKGRLYPQFSLEAEDNFRKALARAPDYHPALLRLGVIRWYQGHFAEAVALEERALAIDPRADWVRRPLAEAYLEVGEVDAARSVLLEAPEPLPSRRWLAICLYAKQLERGTDLLHADPLWEEPAFDADVPVYLIRDAALANGRLASGGDELLALKIPHTLAAENPWVQASLAQLRLSMGERQEAEQLAREVLGNERPGRYGGLFLTYPRAAALTLLAQNDAALDLLEEAFSNGHRWRWWYAFSRDPAFEPLRNDPGFQALAARAEMHAAAEREAVRQMRERGQVPTRTLKKTSKAGPC